MSSGLPRRSKERERAEDALEVAVDISMAVKVVDGTEDRADDGGGVVLGEPAAPKDAVKREVCARLETWVNFGLGRRAEK